MEDRVKVLNGKKMISILVTEEELSFIIREKQNRMARIHGKNVDRLLKKSLKARSIMRNCRGEE